MNDKDLRAENARLIKLNDGLSRQVLAMGATLEAGRRELLATGWDACAESLYPNSSGRSHPLTVSLKDANPYRKPAIDFSGAIICKTGDGE